MQYYGIHIHVPDIIIVILRIMRGVNNLFQHSIYVSFWSIMILDRVTIELRMSPLLVASVIVNTPNEYGRLLEN